MMYENVFNEAFNKSGVPANKLEGRLCEKALPPFEDKAKSSSSPSTHFAS